MDNPQLDLAYKYAQYTHRNIFLTGKAGTGKTTFLRRLQKTSQKRMIVVAPTGVAAINAGGATIHSFFQLAPGMFIPGQGQSRKDGKSRYGYSKHKINIFRSLDLLVIDEISMVRCDLLDAIDDILRRYQDRSQPFGGVQLLMIGDLQQLAPVTTDEEWQVMQHYYPTPYFFGSQALRMTNYTVIELKTVYRQADQTFIDILNSVRDNRIDQQTLQRLNARYQPDFRPSDDEGYITLTTHNYQAQDINTMHMTLLHTPARKYKAQVSGDFPEASFPTEQELTLKVGAQVMFCKNDPTTEKAYFNGKIGQVIRMEMDRVVVRCTNDGEIQEISVGPQEWTNMKYKTNERTGEITEEEAGKFVQIPLKTAWAITIHKSQGLTFDRAIINAGKAFSPGQVYVALSRCRSLEGLVLSTPINPSVVTVDPVVLDFNQQVHEPTSEELTADSLRFLQDTLCQIFDFRQLMVRLHYVLRLYEMHLATQYPKRVARLREITLQAQAQLHDVGLRFQQQIVQLMPLAPTYEENVQLQERFQKAIAYYTTQTAEILQEFISDGLPEIDNKSHREQLEKEMGFLKADYDLKMLFFIKCATGFSLDAYWNAKAEAAMQADGTEPKTTRRKSKTTSKTATPEKIKVSADDDILHPKLFKALRDWRTEKAATLNVPPYTIMHNATLIALSNVRPTSGPEFLAIPGIGKKVLSAFGKELLDIIEAIED